MYSNALAERGIRVREKRRSWIATPVEDAFKRPANWRSVIFKASSAILLIKPMVIAA
jgi:hypothetical protein